MADKAQMPKQGTATYVTYYTSHSPASLDMGGVGEDALWEPVGITRNADGQKLFDSMSVRCLYFHTAMGGKVGGVGACTETDMDGDKIFTTFDAAARVHTLIGGTGKYKGISGTAPYTVIRLSAPDQGLGATEVEHNVTWQFKLPGGGLSREYALSLFDGVVCESTDGREGCSFEWQRPNGDV
ncbi:hypothetical protein [Trinickia violacea]|uniref:hypothetical protein n=1 Tax=Trinickia violacea TaxID=2571746 RepID=UPI0015860C2E|nr:hypothetical protein [Trinickia violacea]